MKPDVVYVITAGQGQPKQRADEATLARRKAETEQRNEEFVKEMAQEGLDPDAVRSARDRAYNKARRALDEANRKLAASGQDPIVITEDAHVFRPDVQAALRKAGVKIELDKTGFTRKDGTLITPPWTGVYQTENASWETFNAYYTRLQRHLAPERPILNMFLFVRPDDKAEGPSKNLSGIAKRNGGSFQILTTKRLEEIQARDEATKN
jgi:hypothetical protein